MQAAGYIDASPLLAGDRAYLYFSVDWPRHGISVVPQSADMLSVAGPRVGLFGVTQGWEAVGNGTVEGPTVFAWGAQCVMLYSGGDWRGQYGMGYAVATFAHGSVCEEEPPAPEERRLTDRAGRRIVLHRLERPAVACVPRLVGRGPRALPEPAVDLAALTSVPA